MITVIGGSGGGADACYATFCINDTTVGNSMCPALVVRQAGTTIDMVLIDKFIPASNLTVRLNRNGLSLGTITIASGTPTLTPIIAPLVVTLFVGDVLTVDVTSSDNYKNPYGVATLELHWTAS